MSDLELAFAPVTTLVRLLRDREVAARDLVALFLGRIERLDPAPGSYVQVLADRARDTARLADERAAAGEDPGSPTWS